MSRATAAATLELDGRTFEVLAFDRFDDVPLERYGVTLLVDGTKEIHLDFSDLDDASRASDRQPIALAHHYAQIQRWIRETAGPGPYLGWRKRIAEALRGHRRG